MNNNQENRSGLEEFMPPQMIMHKIICVGAGLILPLILIPVVKLTGFSEIIEEIAKTIIIGLIILEIPGFKSKVIWTAVFGFCFSISETIFYISKIIDIGNYSLFFDRLFLTLPMHIITALIILIFGNIKKRYLIIGLVFAILIHLGFNYFVTDLFDII